jgi:hypothetical protein
MFQILFLEGVAIKLAGKFSRKRTYSMTTKWCRRQTGYDDNLPLCPGANISGHQKRRYKATLIIRFFLSKAQT